MHSALTFFADLASLALFLGLSCVLGLPLVRAVGSKLTAPLLFAPALGFGWLCVIGTILYRFHLAPRGVFIGALLAAAAIAVWAFRQRALRFEEIDIRRSPLFAGIFLVVILLALLPAALGGPQFSLFQGNIADQFNHLGLSVSVDHYDYDFLTAVTLDDATANNFLLSTSYVFGTRPAVNIGYAVLSPLLFGEMYEKTYVFIAFLQVLFFLSITALLKNLLQLAQAAIIGAACAVGFFTQYIIDIDAWSHLAGIGAACVALTVTIMYFVNSDGAPPGQRALPSNAARVALAWIPLVFIYPESVLPYLIPLISGIAAGMLILRSGKMHQLANIGVAGLLVLAVAALSWNNTIGVLAQQISLALHIPIAVPNFVAPSAISSAVEMGWHQYYQKYIFDASVSEPNYTSWYAIYSWPVDALYGVIGLYFLRPSPDLPLFAKIAWKAVLWLPLCLLLGAAAIAAWRSMRNRATRAATSVFVLTAIAALVPPLVLAIGGLYWTAGKVLAIIAPLLFGLLVLPLAPAAGLNGAKRNIAWAYVFASLVFGFFRPVAATADSGIHYAAPYPAISNPAFKTAIDWDVAGVLEQTRQCKTIDVNVEDPFLDTFVQIALTERNAQWRTVRPINTYYGMGRTLAPQAPKNEADCKLATYRDANTARLRLGLSGAGLAVTGDVRTRVEIALGSQADINVSGVYGAETYQGKPLRWSDGAAEFAVPQTVFSEIKPTRIAVKLWGIGPAEGLSFRLFVNDAELLSGKVNAAPIDQTAKLPALTGAGPVRIRLESSTFATPGDSRKLGVAIQSIELIQ